jgi:CBS domain containing-hemolysin-like protein
MSAYLSACQFGITLASLGIGFLGEPAIAARVEPTFGDLLSHGVASAAAVAFAYVVVTFAHITAGEQAPKIFAIAKAEQVARRVARPLQAFHVAMRPAITALNHVSNGMVRLTGVDPKSALEGSESPEELRLLIARAYSGGKLDSGEAGMLEGVFHLHEQQARQVMTPIPAVVTIDISEDAETALLRGVTSGHTRLVVTEDFNPNRLRGLVHTNALARQLMKEGPKSSIESLVREAPVVPETKPLDDLLAELQRMRKELAVVVDEYGRVAGIVTVEDIVEEIVGEIEEAVGAGSDESPTSGPIRRLPNGDWFVRGHVPVTDLLDYDVSLPVDDAYNSVGGLVFARLGRLPKRGDTIEADGYSIRVESVRENRVEAVRIRPRPEKAGDHTPQTPEEELMATRQQEPPEGPAPTTD